MYEEHPGARERRGVFLFGGQDGAYRLLAERAGRWRNLQDLVPSACCVRRDTHGLRQRPESAESGVDHLLGSPAVQTTQSFRAGKGCVTYPVA